MTPRGGGKRSKKGFAAALAQIAADHPEAERIEVWFQDGRTHRVRRVGQKGRMVRRWFQRGMRPRMVKDQRYRSAYIFGAVCPARDTGAALVLPHVSVAAMNLLLKEVAPQLPPYSPELNAIEKVWQYLRDRSLSGRLFAGTRVIVDACCAAWNSLIAATGRIRSLADFDWARPVIPLPTGCDPCARRRRASGRLAAAPSGAR